MKINPDIFRAYDIRGVYPSEFNEQASYFLGRAFVRFLGKNKKISKIVVGRDNRLSSPTLFKSLVQGITDEGVDVIDIGFAISPMFYWAVAHYGYDAGVQVSASHNPPQYNGLKLVREKAKPISGQSGLQDIKKLTNKLAKQGFIKTKKRRKIYKRNVLADYIKFNLRDFRIRDISPSLKIVIDTANAVPGVLIPYLKSRLPVKIYHLFPKLDGRFPNHPPDPLNKANLAALKKEILKQEADLGVAFDGDGDRIVFLDEKRVVVRGDLITALLSQRILKDYPKAKILYDVRSSNTIRETIKKYGGRPLVYRIGHSFIKEKMRKENILFGGEFSGHFYHKRHYFVEAPLFVLLKVLEIISEEKKSFSEIIKPFKKYYHSGEINFKVKDKGRVIKKVKNRYKNGKALKIDGLRIDFKDWWFLIRPSNTEPVLRLVLEAKTKKLMEQKKKELINLISSI